MSAKNKADRSKPGGSDAPTCSAWIPASTPPKVTHIERVIARAETDEVAEAFWLTSPKPGFYLPRRGGVTLWPYVTHWIPWPSEPNAELTHPETKP